MTEIICAMFVLINLAILGLNLKLYTEILKEKSQQKRAEAQSAGGGKG